MSQRSLHVIAIASALALVAGCAAESPLEDENVGESRAALIPCHDWCLTQVYDVVTPCGGLNRPRAFCEEYQQLSCETSGTTATLSFVKDGMWHVVTKNGCGAGVDSSIVGSP